MAANSKVTKVKIKDTAEGRRFNKELEKLKTMHLKVGFQSGKATYANEDGGAGEEVDVCDVAAWNELGTSRSPSRPFLSNSISLHEEEIEKFCASLFSQMAKGKITGDDVWKKMGVYQKGLVQSEITDGEYAPNSEYTIRKKGSDHPLIDTGLMRQSVNYVIVTNEQGETHLAETGSTSSNSEISGGTA